MQQADDNKKSETKDVKKLFYRCHVEIWGQEFSFAAMRRGVEIQLARKNG